MTKEDKIIASLYTGVLFCSFLDYHARAEELLGRPIMTHEFIERETMAELKEASKNAFTAMILRQDYDMDDVTRLEVIDYTAETSARRAYQRRGEDIKMEQSFQDNGRTLKIFIGKRD